MVHTQGRDQQLPGGHQWFDRSLRVCAELPKMSEDLEGLAYNLLTVPVPVNIVTNSLSSNLTSFKVRFTDYSLFVLVKHAAWVRNGTTRHEYSFDS